VPKLSRFIIGCIQKSASNKKSFLNVWMMTMTMMMKDELTLAWR